MNKQTRELLNITLEECAEVTQAISKVFRFGMCSTHPATPNVTNKDHLEEEIGDLLCMIDLLQEKGVLDANAIAAAFHNKREKLKTWSPDALLDIVE
jgi:NTP pyrophosphatase (non-canonical NTP hydrolase)